MGINDMTMHPYTPKISREQWLERYKDALRLSWGAYDRGEASDEEVKKYHHPVLIALRALAEPEKYMPFTEEIAPKIIEVISKEFNDMVGGANE